MIPVDPLAIRAEVGRVLASPGFAHNERLSRFLRFVVERHLEGRGLKVAFFYSKLYLRILRPQWNALLPECDHLPRGLRTALDHLDAEIQKLHQEAALAA